MILTQFEHIVSPANASIKLLRRLERKRNRQETGLFLAEGERLIREGLAQGWRAEYIAVNEDRVDDLIYQGVDFGKARLLALPDRLMEKISRKDNPQSMIGVFHQRSLALETLSSNPSGIWVGLYQVRDPGNLGTILRAVDCAGASGVVLLDVCCDIWSVETVRATMGSIFNVNVAAASFDEFNHWRKEQSLPLVAASINGKMRHDQADMSGGVSIIMGNEQAGLPDSIEKQCSNLVRIPMRGGADSLNLAQATTLMVYEAWRQKGFAL